MRLPHAGRHLDRATVVDAAISHADAQGLEELNMRGLADSLAVTPMALYNHVSSRESLLDDMVERLVAGITLVPQG